MIYSLAGVLKLIEENYLIIECGGVGYKCFATSNSQRGLSNKIGTDIYLYTYMSVREDAIDLFGFTSLSEMKCFKLLTSVSGVGAKVGLAILSEFSPEQVAAFISSNNSKSITKASGVGNKLAQRIILELRDKFKMSKNALSGGVTSGVVSMCGNVEKAADALGVLGYDKADVIPILSKLESGLSVEEMIRQTLKSMKK